MKTRVPEHEYANEVAAAAQWALDNKHRTMNWNWWVFSHRNTDSTGLKFPEVVAFNIINILAAKELITPIEGQPHEYALNLSNLKKWEEITHVPNWFERNVLFPLGWAWRHLWLFIFWILSLVISAGLTHLIKKLIDAGIPTNP